MTSRVIHDEDLGSHVRVVTEHRSRHREVGKHLQPVSASTSIPSSVTPAAMAVAHSSLGPRSRRLLSNQRKDVVDRY